MGGNAATEYKMYHSKMTYNWNIQYALSNVRLNYYKEYKFSNDLFLLSFKFQLDNLNMVCVLVV